MRWLFVKKEIQPHRNQNLSSHSATKHQGNSTKKTSKIQGVPKTGALVFYLETVVPRLLEVLERFRNKGNNLNLILKVLGQPPKRFNSIKKV